MPSSAIDSADELSSGSSSQAKAALAAQALSTMYDARIAKEYGRLKIQPSQGVGSGFLKAIGPAAAALARNT